MSEYDATLLPEHIEILRASGVPPEVAEQRRYRSETVKARLAELGFGVVQRRVPGLLIPIWNVHGEIATHQVRPDAPREQDGRPLKYETPRGGRLVIDVPPAARPHLGDPKRPLFVTEGARKADAAVAQGLCCIALLGVWGWRGTNAEGGKAALPDWEAIALNGRTVYLAFDSDVTRKASVARALTRLAGFVESRGAHVEVIYLPSGDGGVKVGLDDYFAAGHTVEDVLALARPELPRPAEVAMPPAKPKYTGPPVDLPDLLNQTVAFLTAYVEMGAEQAVVCALWAAHTWVFDAWDATAYLRITSPERECGKTLLGELLELVCKESFSTVGITPAALFRTIDSRRPTLILDELDQMLKKPGELVAAVIEVINAGYRRGKTVTRCMPPGWEPEDFDVFCPKVLIGIGSDRLPDTTLSRTIEVQLHRKPRGTRRRYRARRVQAEAAPLAERLEAWASTVDMRTLGQEEIPDDDFPPELGDRAADIWEPLLLIARHAGAEWWQRAVSAAVELNGNRQRGLDRESYQVRLLAAVRIAFDSGGESELPTRDLILRMAQDEEAPWAEWVDRHDGEPKLTQAAPRRLGTVMRRFGARSHDLWTGSRSVKGYRRGDLEEAFASYLPAEAHASRETREIQHSTSDKDGAATGEVPPSLAHSPTAAKWLRDGDLADLAGLTLREVGNQPRLPVPEPRLTLDAVLTGPYVATWLIAHDLEEVDAPAACAYGSYRPSDWSGAIGNRVCGICHPRPTGERPP